MNVRNIVWSALALTGIVGASGVEGQTLGTYRWQLRPYCNVVTVTVTAVEGTYRLEGSDDQCGGAADKASAIGTAFPNPDGTIGVGLTIVATPGGAPVHVDASLAPGAFDGTWRDSAGGRGDFVLTPGAGAGGTARPLPSSAVPATIGLRPEGSIVAAGTEGAPIPASGTGRRMMWHAGKAAFRAGGVDGPQWDEQNVGAASAGFGVGTLASGFAAFAAGDGSRATGAASAALGRNSAAIGAGAFAAGVGSRATGAASVALGHFATTDRLPSSAPVEPFGAVAIGQSAKARLDNALALGASSNALGAGAVAIGRTTAAGNGSVAIGRENYAGGDNSIVIGGVAQTTTAATGSIVLADGSPDARPIGFQSFAPNQFLVRAAGGIQFFSNAELTAGVALDPGGNSWLNMSDAHAKHLYRDLDHHEVLDRIAALPIREWSYTSEDPSVRHMGPTAQDFRAAFGLGRDPKRIATIDADGVALAAVKALEARTRTADDDTRAAIQALRAEIAALRSALSDLQADRARVRVSAVTP